VELRLLVLSRHSLIVQDTHRVSHVLLITFVLLHQQQDALTLSILTQCKPLAMILTMPIIQPLTVEYSLVQKVSIENQVSQFVPPVFQGLHVMLPLEQAQLP